MPKKKEQKTPKIDEPKKKSSVIARADHPAVSKLKDDERIKKLPDDFSFAKHKIIKKMTWERDDMFFDHLASKQEEEAKGNREKAEECRKLGSAAERGRAKRLLKMQSKIDELKTALTEKGIDVNALLASVS